MAKKEKIYVLCTSKSEYSEVLKYKARLGHRWRQSQQLVLNNNDTIHEWLKYGKETTLGIHQDGGMCRLEKAREKGTVISFNDFVRNHVSKSYIAVPDPTRVEEAPVYRAPKTSESFSQSQSQDNSKSINNQNSTKMTNSTSNSVLSAFVPARVNPSDVVMTMTGKIAYRRKDGEYVRYDADQDAVVKSLDLFKNFEIGKFCFTIPTAPTALAVGDVIFHKGDYKEIISLEGGIKTVNLNSGANSTIKKEIIEFINVALISKVVCLFGNQQTSAGTTQFNPMMLMMLSQKDGGFGGDKMGDLLPLLMMGGANPFGGAADQTGANPMASMLPLMMLSGDKGFGGDDSFMQMMLMYQLSGGQGGVNPFASMFGGVATPATTTKAVATTELTTAEKLAAAQAKLEEAKAAKELAEVEKEIAAVEAETTATKGGKK